VKFWVRSLCAMSLGVLALLGAPQPGHFSLVSPALAQAPPPLTAPYTTDITNAIGTDNTVTVVKTIYNLVLNNPTLADSIAYFAVTNDPTIAPVIISVTASAASYKGQDPVAVAYAGFAALEALPVGGPGQLTATQIGALINQSLVQVEGKTQLNLTPAQLNALENDPALNVVNNQAVSPY
jgi:hypothetical protein